MSSPENSKPKLLECDLILKGGVASGVVFPAAVSELARTYRFRALGGTSAGAIAAVVAAAAEFGRQKKRTGPQQPGEPDHTWLGFKHIEDMNAELADRASGISKVASLFRPSPRYLPLFNVMMTALRQKQESGDSKKRGWPKIAMSLLPSIFHEFPKVWVPACFISIAIVSIAYYLLEFGGSPITGAMMTAYALAIATFCIFVFIAACIIVSRCSTIFRTTTTAFAQAWATVRTERRRLQNGCIDKFRYAPADPRMKHSPLVIYGHSIIR